MTKGRTVEVRFAGEASGFQRVIKDVSSTTDKESRKMAGALDRAGEASGNAEGKFMGMADVLDGLGGAFGVPTEGATNLMRSFGDLSGGFEVLQPLVGKISGSFGAFGKMLRAHPVFLIVGVITALAAALVYAYNNSETFRNIVNGAFEAVKAVALPVFNAISDVVQGVFGWVRDNWPLLLTILTGPIGLAVSYIVRHWDEIKSGFATVVGWISGAVGDVVRTFTDMVDRIRSAFSSVVGWIGDRVEDVVGFFTGLRERISAAVSGAFDRITSLVEGLKDGIAGIAQALWDPIVGGFKDALNWIIRKWNAFEVRGPDIPGLGQFVLRTPDLPTFHRGGVVPGVPGTEVPILAEAGEVVLPRGRTAGAPLIGSLTVRVDRPLATPREVRDAVVEALNAHFSRGGVLSDLRGRTLRPT